MPDSPSVPRFHLEVGGLRRRLAVVSFRGHEVISQPYVFTLDVLCDNPDITPAHLMYQSAFLALGQGRCGVHGQIQAVTRNHSRPGPVSLRLSLGPRLACLAQRYTPRVFQHMSATQIIDQVLSEHGLLEDSYRFELKALCVERAFCAQYRENDLQFIQRLCAEEGIHYHFVHSPHHHELVFANGLLGARRTPEAPWRTRLDTPGITRMLVWRYKPARPGTRYGWSTEGHSTLAFVSCGHLMPVTGHVLAECNDLWRITHVFHRGCGTYANRFVGRPWENDVRVPPVEAQGMPALQRAWLIGPPGQEAKRDPAGRVQVQFEWTLQGHGARFADCWLPVDARTGGPLRGGMAVLVGLPTPPDTLPVVIARLDYTPDEPCTGVDTSPRVQARLDAGWLVGEGGVLSIDGGPRIELAPGAELAVQVGASEVCLNAEGLSLSSPTVSFSVSADKPAVMAAQAPGDKAQADAAQQGEEQEGQP